MVRTNPLISTFLLFTRMFGPTRGGRLAEECYRHGARIWLRRHPPQVGSLRGNRVDGKYETEQLRRTGRH